MKTVALLCITLLLWSVPAPARGGGNLSILEDEGGNKPPAGEQPRRLAPGLQEKGPASAKPAPAITPDDGDDDEGWDEDSVYDNDKSC